MELPFFQLDAFTSELFEGNPAGVVLLPEWLPDDTLQSIAAENQLPDTAFVVPGAETFALRWFTPEMEVDLCGHATLASAYVLFHRGYTEAEEIIFRYGGGTLTVRRKGEFLEMVFPSRCPEPVAYDDSISRALGAKPTELLKSRDLLAVFESQAEIDALEPDFSAVAKLDAFGVIASAPGDECDFVSRFFAPQSGIEEDWVTGSAHCTLAPYWAGRLGREKLHAVQGSRRKGEIFCEMSGDEVKISGRVVEYLRGHIQL